MGKRFPKLIATSDIQKDQVGRAVRLDFSVSELDEIETSVLHLPHRHPQYVICSPSQIGCVMRCVFCGLRDRKSAENLNIVQLLDLIDQTKEIGEKLFQKELKPLQVSFMGQGEPLSNIENIIPTIEYLIKESTISEIGISTIGNPIRLRALLSIPKYILSTIRLQLSLHAPMDDLRWRIMPGTKNWLIGDVIERLEKIAKMSRKKVCLNYILLKGINDSVDCLDRLINIANPNNFYIKLSVLNEVAHTNLESTNSEILFRFFRELKKQGYKVKIGSSAGRDIMAGCGQIGRVPTILDLSNRTCPVGANSLIDQGASLSV